MCTRNCSVLEFAGKRSERDEASSDRSDHSAGHHVVRRGAEFWRRRFGRRVVQRRCERGGFGRRGWFDAFERHNAERNWRFAGSQYVQCEKPGNDGPEIGRDGFWSGERRISPQLQHASGGRCRQAAWGYQSRHPQEVTSIRSEPALHVRSPDDRVNRADCFQRIRAVELPKLAALVEIEAVEVWALRLRDEEGLGCWRLDPGLSRASPQRPHAL